MEARLLHFFWHDGDWQLLHPPTEALEIYRPQLPGNSPYFMELAIPTSFFRALTTVSQKDPGW